MKFNLLAFSIPFFVLLICLEYYLLKKKNKESFNIHNVISNVSVGIAERLCDVFLASIFFGVYTYLQQHYGLFTIKPALTLWILLFIATDFVWYWYHRLAHEINILWAVHIVHHQSEEFNFTVSARITVLQGIIRGGFWCILPLLGFPATMITSLLLLHGLYPFFLHTRLIGNLGILEYLLVTPSHHRVHHASNEEYLDKNYGDVLIIWDKLFGTFQPEEANKTIVYGLADPLNTYSFLWQHFHFFIELWLAVAKKRTWKEKLLTIFGKPENVDKQVRKEAEAIFRVKQSLNTIERPLNTYVIWQIILLLIALFGFLLLEKNLSLTFSILFTLFTVLTLINCGAIMEQKKWVFNIELARAFLILLIPFYYSNLQIVVSVAIAILLFVATKYKYTQNKYLQIVYRS